MFSNDMYYRTELEGAFSDVNSEESAYLCYKYKRMEETDLYDFIMEYRSYGGLDYSYDMEESSGKTDVVRIPLAIVHYINNSDLFDYYADNLGNINYNDTDAYNYIWYVRFQMDRVDLGNGGYLVGFENWGDLRYRPCSFYNNSWFDDAYDILYRGYPYNSEDYLREFPAIYKIAEENMQEQTEEFVKLVNVAFHERIPNLYWQTIMNAGDTYTVNNAESTEIHQGYGQRNAYYFTTTFASYMTNITEYRTLSSSDYMAYTDSSNQFCAVGIEGTWTANLVKQVITINAELIIGASNNAEITGLFLDKQATTDNPNVRAVELNITGEQISEYTDVPLWIRFESEGIPLRGSDKTFVMPHTINVNGYQEKPFIIAYEAPDPNRTSSNSPKINSSTGAYATTGTIINTATVQSAPFTVNLNNADFNGILYCPFSTVTITGVGKIYGFILAAEIIDQSESAFSSERKVFMTETELPTWGATLRNGTQRVDYTVQNVRNTYVIAYDEFDTFNVIPHSGTMVNGITAKIDRTLYHQVKTPVEKMKELEEDN